MPAGRVIFKILCHRPNNPALPLFRAIQCFDPRFIQSNIAHRNMGDYKIIEEFQFLTDTLIQDRMDFEIYMSI
uniref:Uncharacterized protein n=1 Tax=Rhizophagus irregularis (strain DAOM 181602 / DAOM 197198 / MUCL 43194) TaxID=747089 RepID=U9V0G4_RHIID